MTIGLICAIPQELTHLHDVLADSHSRRVAHTVFHTGTLDGRDVVLAGSGMGRVNAAIVTTLLADRLGCRTIVFTGVAGGLDPSLPSATSSWPTWLCNMTRACWRTNG